jgi:hypothetical protein
MLATRNQNQMKTYQQKLIKGLINLGWIQGEPTSNKYIPFSKVGHKSKLFVGGSGALRVGSNPSSSRSVGNPSSVSSFYKKILDASEDETISISETPIEFPSVSSTLTTKNQVEPMPTQQQDLTSIVRELEIHRNKIKEQETNAAGAIQKALQDVADSMKTLRESGLIIDISKPEFDQAITEMGLQVIKNKESTKTRTRLTKEDAAKLDALMVDYVSAAKGKVAEAKDIIAHAVSKGFEKSQVVPRLKKVLKSTKNRGEYTLQK